MSPDARDHLVIAPRDRRRTIIALIRSARRLAPHGKLLIVDKTSAVIGSIALRTAAFQSGRELAVVIHDLAVVRQLDAFWFSLTPLYTCWQPPQAAIQEIRP